MAGGQAINTQGCPHVFRMARGHRVFTAALLAAVAVTLILPAVVLAMLLPAIPRWLVALAAGGIVVICECYARQMFATFTVTDEGLTYVPGGLLSRRWSRPRQWAWRDWVCTVYRAQPKQSEIKLWRGIPLPVYLTNPGVPMRTLQFYTDSFLGMYAVIGMRPRFGKGPQRWLGVPQCIEDADAMLLAIVANSAEGPRSDK